MIAAQNAAAIDAALEAVIDVRVSIRVLAVMQALGSLDVPNLREFSDRIEANMAVITTALGTGIAPHAMQFLPLQTLGEVAARAKARPALTAIKGGKA